MEHGALENIKSLAPLIGTFLTGFMLIIVVHLTHHTCQPQPESQSKFACVAYFDEAYLPFRADDETGGYGVNAPCR